MKSKRFCFSVNIHKRSTHFVSVVIYNTTAAMRSMLTKIGHDSKHTDGACWQPHKHQPDGCIAEIHLSRQLLTMETIAHESAHAAFHRSRTIGIPLDDDSFQEYLAEDTGVITEAIVAMCDKSRIPVRYRKINRRMI